MELHSPALSAAPTLTVSPLSLRFAVELNCQSSETLHVTNPHDRDVCFKVKTTAPRRYCVRPNAARIPPKQTVKVEVLAQAMTQYPPEDKCKDKFLVQMAWLPDKEMDVIEHWKNLGAYAEKRGKDDKPFGEKKLKSVLVVPGRAAASGEVTLPPATSAKSTLNESEGRREQTPTTIPKVEAPSGQTSAAQVPALAKGGADEGVKKVELMYAVMATLLAFIFGYFL